MESDAILKMVEDAFRHRYFTIDVFASKDESTIRDVIKTPSKGVQGQFPRSYKRKIDEEIPVISFLVDPSHHVIFFVKHIFSIVID